MFFLFLLRCRNKEQFTAARCHSAVWHRRVDNSFFTVILCAVFSSIVFVHCCSVVSLIFLSVTRIVKIRFFCYPLFAFILCSHVTGKQKNCILCPFTTVYYVPSQLYTMSLHSCIPCVFTFVYHVPSQLVYHVPSQLYTMCLHSCIPCAFTVVYYVPSQLYTMCLHRAGRAFFRRLNSKKSYGELHFFTASYENKRI